MLHLKEYVRWNFESTYRDLSVYITTEIRKKGIDIKYIHHNLCFKKFEGI